MYWRASREKPYAPNLAIFKSWCIVPKAFYRSMSIAHKYPSLFSIFFQFSSMYTRQCCVLWFFLKPVNRFDSLSCMSASVWLYMIFSKTFDKLNKTLMFVISERCISSVTLSMSARMSSTGVALEPSILKITCRTCSSITCWKENFLLLSQVFLILSILGWKMNFLRMLFEVTGGLP